jgi:hypothetical protein
VVESVLQQTDGGSRQAKSITSSFGDRDNTVVVPSISKHAETMGCCDFPSTSQPRVGMKRSSPTNRTDLSVALQTFNKDTMVQACSLLLSERDYQEGAVDAESDYDVLVSIFVRCKDAARIVEQQATFVPMKLPPLHQTAPPPTSTTITPSARAAALSCEDAESARSFELHESSQTHVLSSVGANWCTSQS